MPIGKKNLAAIVVANVGSLPPGYTAYGIVNYPTGSPRPDVEYVSVTIFSLNSTNLPSDTKIVGALVYSGPTFNSVPVKMRKVAY